MKTNNLCFSKTHSTKQGFTLIEILIVLIIITILAGFVGLNVLQHPGTARQATAKLQVKTLQSAIKLYHAEQHRFPTQQQGLDALVTKPEIPPIPANYPTEGYLDSRTVPMDPWGTAYIYLIPGRNGETFEIMSYGSDNEPGGEGEDADISSAVM
ncbi:MAG: type II secretion system protein GspG [Spartobacteria bacterium]|nr:type II secretion system protein GspG [Spartobacteria bacterium]